MAVLGSVTAMVGSLLLAGEPHRLSAERVVLAERMPVPVVLHEDADEVRVALELDAHHVPGLPLVPVGGRPDGDEARHGLAVLEPDLEADPGRLGGTGLEPEQVVGDREAVRLRVGLRGEAPRAGLVDVAPAGIAPVAGHPRAVPAEVVGGAHVGEEVEACLVAEPERGLAQALALDDDGRLAVTLLLLDEPGNAVELRHWPAPRIS